MHPLKASSLWLLVAMAGVVVAVGALPMFRGTAYALLNYNLSAVESKFTIPGGPLTRTSAAVTVGQSAPFTLTVSSTAGFPVSGQVLVSDGAWGDGDEDNAEIMTYSGLTGGFQITQRGATKVPGSANKAHGSGSKVKLATVSTATLAATTGPQSRLTDGDGVTAGLQDITAIQGGCTLVPNQMYATCPAGNLPTPFLITLTSTAGFGTSGALSITHQDVQTSNLLGGQTGEYMEYDNAGAGCPPVGANQLCIVQRAQQPDNRAYPHKRNSYPQPGGNMGQTKVSVHFQLSVKNNVGFFPVGNLMICDANDGTPAALANCELIDHNNAAAKIKIPGATEFHMTERGAPTNRYDKTTVAAHGSGSIVTGADAFLHCRNGIQQPGVDGNLQAAGLQEPTQQTAGTSVGVMTACYTESQPGVDGPPKPPTTIIGQDPVVWNSIAGQPFLSTGGFCHVVLGAVDANPGTAPDCVPDANCADAVTNDADPLVNEGCPQVGATAEVGTQCTNAAEDDGDGTGAINDGCPLAFQAEPFDTDGLKSDANNCDGDGNFTELVLCLGSPCITDSTPGINLKVEVQPLGGAIHVVLDTVHDSIIGNADDCDDPAATDIFTFTVYDTPTDAENKDDDTDRDGCRDERELRTLRSQGGLRDPWNPYDYYDINHDGAVNVVTDILQVAAAFGAGDPDYLPRKDRGTLNYGPFSWNKSAPNGSVDVVNDILGVATQFGDPCPHNHALYTGSPAWPAGNAPWYGVGVVPGH